MMENHSKSVKDASLYFAIAIIELVLIHSLGSMTLMSAAITGMTTTLLTLGISYAILLILILLYLTNKKASDRIKEGTLIDKNPTASFLLLVSLIFFILCIGIGGNTATLIDLSHSSGLNNLFSSVSIDSAMILGQTFMTFFIFFFGPLAYIALATGQGTRESMETMKLKFTKRSFLYFLAGVPALLALNGAVNYALYFLQELFNFQLAENVVAIEMSQGMSVAVAFVMSALTAFGEELFFRGFMQNRAGVLLTTIIFTASHISYGNLGEIILVFVFSLVMGYSVKKTKDLGFAIGMHFTNNFATIILINYFPHLLGA